MQAVRRDGQAERHQTSSSRRPRILLDALQTRKLDAKWPETVRQVPNVPHESHRTIRRERLVQTLAAGTLDSDRK